ncbi:MAG: ATP-binding protein [Thermodesulfovibrionales bacterium]|jgi:signal transduction histidine kinase
MAQIDAIKVMEHSEHINVLLVEDDPNDAQLILESLQYIRSITIKVHWSPNLSSALEYHAPEAFDVIVTDLGLPESKGIESFLQLHAQYPNVPVIVLTGLSDQTLAVQAVRSGAQDYLVKGEVDSASLLKALRYSIERQRLLTELENKLREIRRLERERKSILSMFAHDIKNAIIFSSWFFKRLVSGKMPNLKDNLAAANESLATAEHLLEDFIEFSRFENKEYRPAKDDFDMRAAVLKQIEGARLDAARKNVSVTCSFSEEPLPVVLADKRMIRRVIANLLHNAINYTNAGGTVTVRVQSLGGEILFQIQDNGIGIPDKHIPFIFDAFYRANDDRTGSGLGLSVAKTIIEAHGGKIWAESKPDKGSTFSFTLPEN